MLFTLGMTADAAAAHQHEFSTSQTTADHRTRPASAPTSDVSPASPGRFAAASIMGLCPFRPVLSGSTEGPQTPESLAGVEADIETLSDSGFSGKSSNGVLPSTRRKKVAPTLRTSFQIAHPAPTVKHKQRLRIRPRILLQLQQVFESSRPTPALDVLPSVVFAPRLAQKFPRLCKGKDGLGANDLVIVSSEAYDTLATSTNEKQNAVEEESWDHRDVVATICQLRKEEGGARGKVEVCLNHGPSWEATPLLNGAYEFVANEDNGSKTVARWVPRTSGTRRRSSTLQSRITTPTSEGEKKFNFSIINPNSRRHPIIASITRNTIDILDRYPGLSSSGTPHPPTSSPQPSPIIESVQPTYFESSEAQSRTMIETDEQLRTLIVVTGIWVVFRENWSKNFRYSDAMSVPLTALNANPPPSHHTLSVNVDDGIKSHTSSSDVSFASRHVTLQGLGGKVRRTSTQFLHRSVPVASASHNAAQTIPPQRAHSTGAAFIQRANDRSQSVARKARQANSTSSASSGDSHRAKAAEPRKPNTMYNNSVATDVSGSSTSESFASSERQRKTSPARTQSEPNSPVGQGLTNNSNNRRLDNSGYVARESRELRDGERKRFGKLNRLFNIVRRRSGISY
ncbi:MAG: hypothetical protein M1830_001984 [Pleopsidium flavum]|nr:MAG: hypothetical protein M1830_001984 [Pleopsidium flavum]